MWSKYHVWYMYKYDTHLLPNTIHGFSYLTYRGSTEVKNIFSLLFTGDPLHSRAACTQPCNVNTHSRAHCSPGARLCEQWGHGCVNNGARLCASARLCRGSPVLFKLIACVIFIQILIALQRRDMKRLNFLPGFR